MKKITLFCMAMAIFMAAIGWEKIRRFPTPAASAMMFGTHEFLDLCEQLGCEPYICGNVGSGTVEEMSKWVEYITSDGESPMANLRKQNGREKPWKVKFWGVGNENWGCGGNMTAEFYTDQYRNGKRFQRS